MRKIILLVLISFLVTGLSCVEASELRRKTIFDVFTPRTEAVQTLASPDIAPAGEVAAQKEELGAFTLGSMFGLTYALKNQTTYKVVNGVVKEDSAGKDIGDRLLPATYLFPSINVWGVPGNSVSVIVPINVDLSKDTSYGVGLTYGFTVKKSAEIGVALVGLWSKVTSLNAAQRASFDSGTALPAGESSVFGSKKEISIGLGLYIAPLL